MKTVRAKLVVESACKQEWGERVELKARYDESIPEDARFAAATPDGQASFWIDNPSIEGVFVPGRAFYVDFVPVESESDEEE